MPIAPRPDDYEERRAPLRHLSDEELQTRFWSLVDQIVAPLLEEARTHTTPSIERSVLLRMGFSSIEARDLVAGFSERALLGRGVGRLVLDLAGRLGVPVREAGIALLAGRHWEDVAR